ncbi:MAG: glycosyltransferase [Oscillospiraceae bacterium]|nr:glycosyltransferase [Oscillospiraceae bacterium]
MIPLSIVIPAYNTERYLPRCVDSILASDLKDFEIVLVDDGSRDGTGAVCDAYAEKYPFIKAIHQENKGLPAARNVGLEYASGEYIYFVDSDDSIEKEGMQSVMDALLRDRTVQMACFGFTRVYQDGGREGRILYAGKGDYITVQGEDVLYQFLAGPGFVWNKIFRRDLIGDLRFDPSLNHAEDVDFVYKVGKTCKKAMVFRRKLYIYDCERIGNKTGVLNDSVMVYLAVNRAVFESLRNTYPTIGMARCFIAAKSVLCKIPNKKGYGAYYREIKKTLRFRPGEVAAYLKDKKLRDTGKQRAESLAVLAAPHCAAWLNGLRHRR